MNEDVLDAVAELTNMMIGNVKTDLERHLGALGLSIPTVVYGKNFKTKSGANADWVTERFCWEGEDLVIKMCLARAIQPNPNARRLLGQACPVDI